MIKTYKRLIQIPTFEGRYEYLKLRTREGFATFHFERYVTQRLYHSSEWKAARREVLLRDADNEGPCDLGIKGRAIGYAPTVHHINPITLKDIEYGLECLFDPNNLITVSNNTHSAIHYGDASKLVTLQTTIRTSGDTLLWDKTS